MTTLEERRKKVEDLRQRHTQAKTTRDQLLGELGAKRQELASLAQEIKKEGIDPRKLKEHKAQLEEEIDTLCASLDNDLREVEEAMAQFQNPKK